MCNIQKATLCHQPTFNLFQEHRGLLFSSATLSSGNFELFEKEGPNNLLELEKHPFIATERRVSKHGIFIPIAGVETLRISNYSPINSMTMRNSMSSNANRVFPRPLRFVWGFWSNIFLLDLFIFSWSPPQEPCPVDLIHSQSASSRTSGC